MRVIVSAYHDMGCQGVQALLDAGYETATTLTYADNLGEEAFLGFVPRLVASAGIPVYTPDGVNRPLWAERANQLAPDVVFSFYYHHLLSDEILSFVPKGVFNLRGPLLPKYRGRAPLSRVLINGETETDVTLYRMVKCADTGAIVTQQHAATPPNDVTLALHHKLCQATRHLLEKALPAIKTGDYAELP